MRCASSDWALICLSCLALGACAQSDAGSGGSTGADGETGEPSASWCEPTLDWDADSAAWEAEVLEIVNARRSEGADCGSRGTFDPASPVSAQPELRCAARMHSLDMEERGYFSHDDPDGNGPQTRIDNAQYNWSTWGENIAQGYPDPEAVMQGWMGSDGHCSNIMDPSFVHLGVGHYGANQWTQVFGAPG